MVLLLALFYETLVYLFKVLSKKYIFVHLFLNYKIVLRETFQFL